MKIFTAIILSVCTVQLLFAEVVMPRVDIHLFVNQPRTDFDSIFIVKPVELQSAVEQAFEQDILVHSLTKRSDLEANFLTYWKVFQDKWHFVDMNQDGNLELIFSGVNSPDDLQESFSIYERYGKVWKEIFWDDGHLVAYKIHENTGEILLYHHRYPCCTNSTHAINRIRFVNNKIMSTTRYFLARDSDMRGDFFPKKANFKPSYEILTEKTMMYWSKGKITNGGNLYSTTNQIINYPKGTVFKVLAKEGIWWYVQMISPPVMEESAVVNARNLQDSKYFGWIEAP